MLQEKEKVKQDAEAEIHALKAAISRIRNLEAKDREFDRVKARADHNQELVDRWNRFYYNENDGNEVRNESTCIEHGHHDATSSSSHAGRTTPDGRHSEYGGNDENESDDRDKAFKRARTNEDDK